MAVWRNWRAFRIGRTGPVELVALVILALFMAAIGAFQTETEHLPVRVAYWLICIVGGGVIAALIEPLLERVSVLAARPLARAMVQIIAMTFPITLLVWTVSGQMIGSRFELEHLVRFFPQVFVVDVIVVLIAWMLRTALRPHPAARPPAPTGPLMERLPPKFARATLIAVEAEDHYLRVHTSAGQTLILMRFADALDALSAADGLRVHRSWWVAKGAVDSVRWRNGRGELELASGVRAPVSRSYVADVRNAAWAQVD